VVVLRYIGNGAVSNAMPYSSASLIAAVSRAQARRLAETSQRQRIAALKALASRAEHTNTTTGAANGVSAQSPEEQQQESLATKANPRYEYLQPLF
jgi:hypothetical protein